MMICLTFSDLKHIHSFTINIDNTEYHQLIHNFLLVFRSNRVTVLSVQFTCI